MEKGKNEMNKYLKVYFYYTYARNGVNGSGSCQYDMDAEPGDIDDILEIAGDIERTSGFDKKSVVIANWRVFNSRSEPGLDDAVKIIEDIDSWAKAYPEKVFPEPDPGKVKAVCDSLGVTLDSISAMVLRGFLQEWGNKASGFLSKYRDGNDKSKK